jgi:hypothetical protein
MTVNIQDFKPGSTMWNLVRGYNERRGVLGLPYRKYQIGGWSDAATLEDAVVSLGANVQDIKFWNELASAPFTKTNIGAANGRVYVSAFVSVSDSVYSLNESVVETLSAGDYITVSFVDAIAERLASYDTVIYYDSGEDGNSLTGVDYVRGLYPGFDVRTVYTNPIPIDIDILSFGYAWGGSFPPVVNSRWDPVFPVSIPFFSERPVGDIDTSNIIPVFSSESEYAAIGAITEPVFNPFTGEYIGFAYNIYNSSVVVKPEFTI